MHSMYGMVGMNGMPYTDSINGLTGIYGMDGVEGTNVWMACNHGWYAWHGGHKRNIDDMCGMHGIDI